MNAQTEERIPTSYILVYSSPVLGVFMAGMLVNFYFLKFSTDILLIGPAVIGSLLLVARIWDAVTDPAAGWLSDRTNTSLGRRRPWLLGSAVPLGLSIVMLWSPPESLQGTVLNLWIGAAILRSTPRTRRFACRISPWVRSFLVAITTARGCSAGGRPPGISAC